MDADLSAKSYRGDADDSQIEMEIWDWRGSADENTGGRMNKANHEMQKSDSRFADNQSAVSKCSWEIFWKIEDGKERSSSGFRMKDSGRLW